MTRKKTFKSFLPEGWSRTDAWIFALSLKEGGIHEIFSASSPPITTFNHVPPASFSAVRENSPSLHERKPGGTYTHLDKQPSAEQAQRASVEQNLQELRKFVLPCVKCPELVANRRSVVFGTGNVCAKLVFVGEAPGEEEDRQGIPFVGAAGQQLNKIIKAMGLSREEVFICNVLKCRPPGNRSPRPEEVHNCLPYLERQLAIIRPAVICALGTFAARALTGSDQNISALRGRFYDYHGMRLMCTYHPSYLLRNPSEKRKVWEDMKKILAVLER